MRSVDKDHQLLLGLYTGNAARVLTVTQIPQAAGLATIPYTGRTGDRTSSGRV